MPANAGIAVCRGLSGNRDVSGILDRTPSMADEPAHDVRGITVLRNHKPLVNAHSGIKWR